MVPRVQALGCHVHFAQPLSASSWRQNSLMSMSEKTMEAVINGCAWGVRNSQGSLLNRSWQVLTTSPDVQRVLNHRTCDKKHKHGTLLDLSGEPSLQFPKSLCQTLVKQFLLSLVHSGPFTSVKLIGHRQLCHPPHCHRWRHLLARDQTHLSERRSPTGYKRFINRLVIVTIVPW